MFNLADLRQSVLSIAAKIRDMRSRIEKLKREREDVANAPASKADVKAMIAEWVHARGAAYQPALRKFMEPYIRSAANKAPMGLLNSAVGRDAVPNVGGMDTVLCGIFGQAVLDALFREIDAMEWPAEGLPMEKRAAKVAALDKQISELMQQEQQLTTDARAAGIVVEAT